ncbi:MAG: triose-phosphate isomerase [Gemmataceae bacterium]
MRERVVAGNWKMNTVRETGRQLAAAIAKGVTDDRVTVIVCPPFPFLAAVGEAIAGTRVALGAQNCHDKPKGAFTGEVSAEMLVDAGCKYVILGHSERRHILGETDAFINRKVKAALAAGLKVILCVGETEAERVGGQMEAVFTRQVTEGMAGLTADDLTRLVLAYEPVWAIGTGRTASPADAQAAHVFLRGQVAKLFGEKSAAALPIQYGGSVDREKAPALFAQADIDGGLIGGASLKPDDFLAIVQAARA